MPQISTAPPPPSDRDRPALMTVGQLSRRTGLSRKAVRELEGRGLIYTVGRSDGNYRLFDESALWCARTIAHLRGLGLTLAQIEQFLHHHQAHPEQPLEVEFDQILDDVRARLTARINELQTTIARIDAVRSATPSTVSGVDGWDHDPCLGR